MNIALGVVVIILSVVLAFFWGYAESMVPAPKYDNIPNIILIGGVLWGVLIIASYWFKS